MHIVQRKLQYKGKYEAAHAGSPDARVAVLMPFNDPTTPNAAAGAAVRQRMPYTHTTISWERIEEVGNRLFEILFFIDTNQEWAVAVAASESKPMFVEK